MRKKHRRGAYQTTLPFLFPETSYFISLTLDERRHEPLDIYRLDTAPPAAFDAFVWNRRRRYRVEAGELIPIETMTEQDFAQYDRHSWPLDQRRAVIAALREAGASVVFYESAGEAELARRPMILLGLVPGMKRA